MGDPLFSTEETVAAQTAGEAGEKLLEQTKTKCAMGLLAAGNFQHSSGRGSVPQALEEGQISPVWDGR